MTHPTQPADDLDIADLKSRINPAYANTRGTESYERRLCVERIEQQAKRIEELEAYNATRTDELLAATRRIAKLEADLAAIKNAEPALTKYRRLDVDADESDPVERLRVFCSIAMRGRDWLDVERFFDVVEAQIALAREALEKYRNAIDALYNHDESTRNAVIQHFGTLHPQLDLTTGNAVQAIEAREGEFEIWQDDMLVASSSGQRADAAREAMHYAAQYGQDGPVRVFEVTRTLITAEELRKLAEQKENGA